MSLSKTCLKAYVVYEIIATIAEEVFYFHEGLIFETSRL